MRAPRSPEVISGLVSSAGAVAAGTGFTVVRSAMGVYTLTFAQPFRARVTTASAHTTADNRAVVDNTNTQAPIVRTFGGAIGTAQDLGFSFTAVGVT